MEDYIYDIKFGNASTVIDIFKIIEPTEKNSEYIYTAMSNLNLYNFIDEIVKPYIDKKISLCFYHIIDGWYDFWINVKNKDKLAQKIKDILIKFIWTDKVIINEDKQTILLLKNQFNINYYAEIMAG